MQTIYLTKTTEYRQNTKIEGAFSNKEEAWKFYSDLCYYLTPYLRPKNDENEMFYGYKMAERIYFEEATVSSLEDFIKEYNVINNDFKSHVILH